MQQAFKYIDYDLAENVLWTYNSRDTAIAMLGRRDLATWNFMSVFVDNLHTWHRHKPLQQCRPATKEAHWQFGLIFSAVYVDLAVSFENTSAREMALNAQPAELREWVLSHPEVYTKMAVFQPRTYSVDYAKQPEAFQRMVDAHAPQLFKKLQETSEQSVKSLSPTKVNL